jgi:2'-5' RNA ligase
MTTRAIAANRRLLPDPDADIILNTEDCLPHISLAMGCVKPAELDSIATILDAIAHKYAPMTLSVTHVQVATNAIGRKISSLVVEKNAAIQSLHEQIMRELAPHFSYDVEADMLLGPHKIAKSTLSWIANYPTNSSFERFFPHITIGYGELGDISAPIEFSASRLAVCHLGNHCTCRKVLVAVDLG